MIEGIVQGGWGFVWAAYGVSLLLLGGYAVSLAVGLRAEERGHRARVSDSREAPQRIAAAVEGR